MLLAGELEVTLDGESHVLVPGGVAHIPAKVVHSYRNLTECHFLTIVTKANAAAFFAQVSPQAGHRSIESTRVYLHLTNDWLAGEYRRAAVLIDADQKAVADMLAVQQVVGS